MALAGGMNGSSGEVSEWLKEHAWKVCKRLNRASGVRIPLSPPVPGAPRIGRARRFPWWPRRPLATLDRKLRQGRKAATVLIDAGAEASWRGRLHSGRQCRMRHRIGQRDRLAGTRHAVAARADGLAIGLACVVVKHAAGQKLRRVFALQVIDAAVRRVARQSAVV